MNFASLLQRLPGKVKLDEPLSRHTSFRIGGPAAALVMPDNLEELRACLEFARAEGLEPFFLAGGTNLLVRDGGIPGLVVKLAGEFLETRVEGVEIQAGAAARLSQVARLAAEAGLSGLEFAAGIPGSLGGGVVMNAGAHGSELSRVLRRIGLLENGELKEIPASEADFRYRGSRFQDGRALILWARLELRRGEKEEIARRMEEVLRRRRETQPLSLPNAGCIFKNPPGQAAGRLIEQCGLKGRKIGGARISELHANFVVNEGGAKATDVLALIEEARRAVRERFGVELEKEIQVVGVDE